MAQIHYPAGIIKPKLRSSIVNGNHNNHRRRKSKRHSIYKFKNHRIRAFNHTFDSQIELGWYIHLKLHHVRFKLHKRFVLTALRVSFSS